MGTFFIPESNKMEFGDFFWRKTEPNCILLLYGIKGPLILTAYFIYARKQAIVEDGSKFREKENLHHDS